MNRDPGDICRVDDDPSYDYSDYCEGKNYYKPYEEDLLVDDKIDEARLGSLANLLPDYED